MLTPGPCVEYYANVQYYRPPPRTPTHTPTHTYAPTHAHTHTHARSPFNLQMGWFMARYRLKTCILVMCSFSILGSALYALAQLSGHFSLVLIGRLVQGLGISPAVVTTYMARATPPGPLRANGS